MGDQLFLGKSGVACIPQWWKAGLQDHDNYVLSVSSQSVLFDCVVSANQYSVEADSSGV